jgi:hypothetical protein
MGYAPLWRGLEREIRTAAAAALFDAMRARHAVLAPCDSLDAAVRACAGSDIVLDVLVGEYASSRHRVLAAAIALAIKGPLVALASQLERRGAESDSTSMVLLALLQVAARTRTSSRLLRLRLYSETRRRVVRAVIAECRQKAQQDPNDVDTIVPHNGALRDVEDLIDQVQFARSLAESAPHEGESVAEYIARLRARGRRPRTTEVPREFAHQRRPQLDALRDALVRVG